MNFRVAFYKEMLEQWRSYRFLITMVVLAAFGLSSPLIAKMTPQIMQLLPNGAQIALLIPAPTVADAVTQYVKNISQFGILLALLLSMGSVSLEKEKGTAAMVLSKPLSRIAFLFSKFAALSVTFLAALLVAGLGCFYYTLLLFEPLKIGAWFALNGLMLLYLLVYVALTIFFSTLSRSQFLTAGMAFGALILIGAVGALPGVGDYLPSALINSGTALVSGMSVSHWTAVWVSLGMIVASLSGAWLVFRRQEL